MEAEAGANLLACHTGLNEIRWIRDAIASLEHPTHDTTPIYCDNMSTVQWVNGSKSPSKVRYIQSRYHSLREWILRGFISITHIPTTDQLADLGTKPLPVARFRELSARIGYTL